MYREPRDGKWAVQVRGSTSFDSCFSSILITCNGTSEHEAMLLILVC